MSTRLEDGESSEQFVRRCTAAAALGIEHMVVITAGPWHPDAVDTLVEAIPALDEVHARS